jgi:hypothetical protein
MWQAAVATPVLLWILFIASSSASFMPARTTASRWKGDIVLCYMDARSTGAFGPEAQALFEWNPDRFSRLLAYHNASLDDGGGVPVDTLFDSFLFSGNSWYDGKMFWPGLGTPMNKTDWTDYLSMQLTIGAANLEVAAANVSEHLPFSPSSCGLRPSVILSVPYPDPRMQDFGSIGASDRSLNFSLPADRIAAVEWWVHEAFTRWDASAFKHVELTGFYWFFEEITPDDEVLVPTISRTIHALSPSLLFCWIPYYRPGDPHTGRWKELGFDFATLQPNYAFNNVSADDRFPAIRQLVESQNLGVELELDYNIRNPQAGGWKGNFDTYVQTVQNWTARGGSILRTYYYGNIYVTYYAANRSDFPYYTKLWKFVKGIHM